MRKLWKPLLLSAGLAAAAYSGAQAQDQTFVAATYIVDHPALNATIEGVEDVLREEGYVPGENLRWEVQSAQNNMVTQGQIARSFVGDEPDAIVAVSTPSAQSVLSVTDQIPLIFAAITDPVSAKLVASAEHPGGNATGVSDLTPVEADLALIKKVLPDIRRLGVIVNPGEANSVPLMALVDEHAPTHGMEVVKAAAPQTGGVLDAARSLVGRVDAIYVPPDNTVMGAFESVVTVARDSKTPLFASDTSTAERGAMVAQGFEYYDVGRAAGRMLVRVLRGENPAEIPVHYMDDLRIAVNLDAAKAYGVQIPQSVLDDADEVIGR